jgi:hypothetical protein
MFHHIAVFCNEFLAKTAPFFVLLIYYFLRVFEILFKQLGKMFFLLLNKIYYHLSNIVTSVA